MIGWLALDLLGTLLLAAGAMGLFSGGSLLPKAWQFPGHNILLVIIGIAMILPYMRYVLGKGKSKRQQGG